jgi:hypothetical protein
MTMKFMTREEWNAKPAKNRASRDLNGPTTIHWNGGGTKWANVNDTEDAKYNWMLRRQLAVQSFHMNGRGWSDYAYNFAVDPWGIALWEGRGMDIKPASQGTTVGNNTSHSIFVPVGVGDPQVGAGCLSTIDEALAWIAATGDAEDFAVGHRDWKSTTCPGDFLYGALSDLNALSPVGDTGEEITDTPMLNDAIAMFAQDNGYGMVSSAGEVWMSDSATFRGEVSGQLNAPIVDAESTASGKGYYLVASDGGVFTFGDAVYRGSMGDTILNEPIIAIEVQPGGYWLAAADGGVFTFGLNYDGRPEVI